MPIVDLRSDTVTQPDAAMKQAMVEAPLGDDVFGDDPTVNRLEAVAADLTGKEAALFVPTGTMANQIAIRVHTRPGDEVLLEAESHPFNYEAGGAAVIAGVQIRPIAGSRGILGVDAVSAAIRRPDDHFAPATLLVVEDTSNRGGGTVYPVERLDELGALAHGRGLRAHLDGARAFNAVVASGIALDRRARAFDSVCFCLSKGLGCPAGSLLCGPRDLIREARRVRKMLGGGMRQAGMLAGAGLYALEHNIERLADDHRRARVLAEALTARGLGAERPETNIIYVDVPDAAAFVDGLARAGVRCLAVGPGRVRLVLHKDIDDAGLSAAVTAIDAV